MSTPTITPDEIPALRRELAEWYASPLAAEYATMMIRMGRQPIRPAGPAHLVGPMLADAEARRLADAELWYLDEDLCDLVQAATPTMPRFAPVPKDLPYLKGPDGAPLLGGEKVTVVGAPSGPESGVGDGH